VDDEPTYQLQPIGRVESSLTDRADAPNQGDEGGPEAWVVVRPDLHPALRGLQVHHEIVLVTWLDRGDRSVLEVHPRGDPDRPVQGVFATRSPDRPNPVGLHHVRILAIDGTRIRVSDLEAIDGTPVLDIKPALGATADR
jgi:tRNA-Thr(GGU) m(6)t(6)A37 methyltransferase TsaA